MACPHTNTCELFPLFNLKATLRIWQTNYCEGAHDTCQRFQRTQRGERVPAELLPNGKQIRITS